MKISDPVESFLSGSLRPQLFIAKNVTSCGITSHTQSELWINMGVCFACCVSFSFRVCALLRSSHSILLECVLFQRCGATCDAPKWCSLVWILLCCLISLTLSQDLRIFSSRYIPKTCHFLLVSCNSKPRKGVGFLLLVNVLSNTSCDEKEDIFKYLQRDSSSQNFSKWISYQTMTLAGRYRCRCFRDAWALSRITNTSGFHKTRGGSSCDCGKICIWETYPSLINQNWPSGCLL